MWCLFGPPVAMRGGQNTPEDIHRQYTESSTEQTSSRESSLQLKRTQQADTEDFILCGAVTATSRVLSLFIVTTCYSYSYSKIESVIMNCSSHWRISNKSTHQSKPASKVMNTRDSIFLLTLFPHSWYWEGNNSAVQYHHPYLTNIKSGFDYVKILESLLEI
jgi:hypothetical protein